MKVEQKETEQFKPIVITLETLEEAETLMTIMGSISGHGSEDMRVHIETIYNYLYNKDKFTKI